MADSMTMQELEAHIAALAAAGQATTVEIRTSDGTTTQVAAADFRG